METVPLSDLYQAAYLWLRGVEPKLAIFGTRVTFEFPSTPAIHRLLRDYESNPVAHALDFANFVRRLRGRMLAERPRAGG